MEGWTGRRPERTGLSGLTLHGHTPVPGTPSGKHPGWSETGQVGTGRTTWQNHWERRPCCPRAASPLQRQGWPRAQQLHGGWPGEMDTAPTTVGQSAQRDMAPRTLASHWPALPSQCSPSAQLHLGLQLGSHLGRRPPSFGVKGDFCQMHSPAEGKRPLPPTEDGLGHSSTAGGRQPSPG